MLTFDENLKLEKKLKKNELKGIKPSTKTELAELLGTTRQQIYYSCRTEGIHESKVVERKLREWINGKN